MRGWAAVAAIVAALPCAAPALAENTSTLQSAKLDTDFTLCIDEAGPCSTESWHIAINAKGWTARGTTKFGGVTTDWTESCDSGRYRADFGPSVWEGTCQVHGDPDALCFDVEMGSEAVNISTTSHECFQLLAPHICVMRYEAVSRGVGAAADIVGQQKTTLGTVNSCVVSEAQ